MFLCRNKENMLLFFVCVCGGGGGGGGGAHLVWSYALLFVRMANRLIRSPHQFIF